MAAKLQDQNANVVKLRPGKAKGAKSTGGRKPTARLKPRAGESKPAAAKKSAQPTDAEIRAGQQDRLIALHSQHRAKENQEAVAAEALAEIRGQKKLVRAAIQNAGFPLELYDEANKKLKLKTKRTDLEARERIRGLIHEAFGLPVGPQPELALEGVPEAARPGIHWEGVGYTDGIGSDPSDPVGAGVPPENIQDYMRGYSQAMSRNAQGLKQLKADPAAAVAAPPLMVGEDPAKAAAKEAAKTGAVVATRDGGALAPDWATWSKDPDTWIYDQREAFTAWFKALDPEADVEIVHAGAAAMFDRLVEAESGVPEAVAEPKVIGVDTGAETFAGAAPADVVYMLSSEEPFESGRQATYQNGQAIDSAVPGSAPYYDQHPFEASDAELASQTQRRVVQEQRAHEPAEEPGFSDD